MTTIQTAEPVVAQPPRPQVMPVPGERPVRSRQQVLDEIASDSCIGADEYLRDSEAATGE